MNSNSVSLHDPEQLRRQLSLLRARSLSATRNGDFRSVARYTLESARINRLLQETN
jgi:hypothetical protein